MNPFDFWKDVGNYEDRMVEKTEVNGLIVSTCWTSDHGYETAILDEEDVHPVERYQDKEEAQAGHLKWCKEAQTIETVTKLAWFIEGDTEVKLKRKS